jgi:hypothetical protein
MTFYTVSYGKPVEEKPASPKSGFRESRWHPFKISDPFKLALDQTGAQQYSRRGEDSEILPLLRAALFGGRRGFR